MNRPKCKGCDEMESEYVNPATLYAKLSRIMGKLSALPKSGYNSHFNYHFVEAADVVDTIRAALAAENIMFFAEIINTNQEVYERNGRNGTRVIRHSLVKFAFTFACGDTGATITRCWDGEAEDDSDKGVSKSATAAEKYFLLKTFLMIGDAPDTDRDGSYQGKQQPRQNRATSPASASNGNGQASHSHPSQNSPSSAPKNGNGMDKDTARQKAIKMLMAAGVDPNAAIKIEPPPNPPTSSHNIDWANRMIERAKAAS